MLLFILKWLNSFVVWKNYNILDLFRSTTVTTPMVLLFVYLKNHRSIHIFLKFVWRILKFKMLILTDIDNSCMVFWNEFDQFKFPTSSTCTSTTLSLKTILVLQLPSSKNESPQWHGVVYDKGRDYIHSE